MSKTDSEDPPTHDRVRVLFLIDASASMAEGHRLEAIDRFIADMRSTLTAPGQADLGERIEIQAIRFADGAEWHVRLPAPITALDWPPLPIGGGTSMGAALSLASTVFRDPSAAQALHIVVLITDGLPTDDFMKGLADFNVAASDREIVRVAMAIDGCCDVKSLTRFVGGPEPIYVVDSSGVGLADALNLLFGEQIFPRAALTASDQECWACYDMALDAADEYPPAFAFALRDVDDIGPIA